MEVSCRLSEVRMTSTSFPVPPHVAMCPMCPHPDCTCSLATSSAVLVEVEVRYTAPSLPPLWKEERSSGARSAQTDSECTE